MLLRSVDLDALAEDRAFAAAEEPRDPLAVVLAMAFRHDQVRQDLTDRLLARPSE
jgi:hypothetical protein